MRHVWHLLGEFRAILSATVVLFVALCLSVPQRTLVDRVDSEVPAISLARAHYLLRNQHAVFVDVRGVSAYDRSHILGAIQFASDHKAKIPASPSTIVVYGERDDKNAALVARILGQEKRTVYVLSDGWPDWVSLNLPRSVPQK